MHRGISIPKSPASKVDDKWPPMKRKSMEALEDAILTPRRTVKNNRCYLR